MRLLGVLFGTLLCVAPAVAGTRLTGAGSRADDCLATLDAPGVAAAARARTVACRDGDRICDHDGLVNGRCEYWVRVCLDGSTTCTESGVASVVLADATTDTDLTTLARTLDLVEAPVAGKEQCGALTTLTIPLGRRANGTARKGRKRLAVTATAGDGAVDDDAVTFLCKPPRRDRRRGGLSFTGIQSRILEKQCAFSGCHGADAPPAGLVLEGPDVYDALVGVLATTSAAQFAGKKRVVPGAPETSFLMDKLEGKLGPGEGAPMPLGRKVLSDADVESIRKWILAGAPRERVISGGVAGELDDQPRIPTPPIPTGGYQAHMAPFMMGDQPETEGCQLVHLDNPADAFVGQWELFMHEGSHHFILRAFRCDGVDDNHNGTNDCDEPEYFASKYPTGFAPCEQFGFNWGFVVGAQTPHYLVDYQTAETGVAFRMRRNQPLLLNSHYTNPFADTMAEVWVNASLVDASLVKHPARILFETTANVFIHMPPGAAGEAASHLACRFYTDASGNPDPLCAAAGEPTPTADRFALLGLTSHMHKRSGKFVTDLFGLDGQRVARLDDMTDPDDGTEHLYVSTDYDDPVSLAFWPPIIVERGQRLTYTCTMDNGVAQPVRLGCEEQPGVPPGKSVFQSVASGGGIYDGHAKWCRTDADCTGFGTGRCVPANLVLGELADDEMCILPGLYYPCPTDGSSCVTGAE